MSLEKKCAVKIASVYTGTVLGAGFASGKELVNFFVCYGFFGFCGLFAAGIFFSLIGVGVLKVVYQNNITNYHDFSILIFGEKLGAFSEWIVCAFLLILFSAMISAGGEISSKVFNISHFKGEFILSFLCFITFLFELDGFVEINTILAPILVVGGIVIGLFVFFDSSVSVFSDTLFQGYYSLGNNFLYSAFIYVSYNIITAVTVLVSLNKLILSKKVLLYGGIFGGLCVCILGISMSLPLFINYGSVYLADMPILNIILNYDILKYIYVVILLSAIFTTALANGFSLIQNFEKRKKGKFTIKLFLAIWGVIMAQVGFSNFIEVIYPFFGFIGLFEAFFILKAAFFKNFFKKSC